MFHVMETSPVASYEWSLIPSPGLVHDEFGTGASLMISSDAFSKWDASHYGVSESYSFEIRLTVANWMGQSDTTSVTVERHLASSLSLACTD